MKQTQSAVTAVSEGNTISSDSNREKSKVNQIKNWFFTFNNYECCDIVELQEKFNLICDKYLFQEETGENGTPHLQGVITLKKPMRWTEFNLSKKIHWESVKNIGKSYEYCQKSETCTGKKYFKGIDLIVKPVPRIIKDLRPWQTKIVDMVKELPDERTIVWIYEEVGGVGKTSLCRYLTKHFNAVPIEGKKNDILYCAAEHESYCYLIDLERTMEEYVSYAAIEKIKNAYYMCAKYESKPILRDFPHVICFANFMPEVSALSLDRWKIYNIVDNDLVPVNIDPPRKILVKRKQ